MSGGFDILQGNENKVTQTQTTDVEAELNGFYSYDRSFQRHMYMQLHSKPKNDMKNNSNKMKLGNFFVSYLWKINVRVFCVVL